MSEHRSWHKVLFGLLYIFGILFGTILAVLSVWADYEASLFDAALPAQKTLSSMHCPVLITQNEIGIVRASFANKLDRPLDLAILAHISDGHISLMREDRQRIIIEPGDQQKLEWQVTEEDKAWDRLIFARLYQFRSSPVPSKTGTCGILVGGFPGVSGMTQFYLALIISIACIFTGYIGWRRLNQPLKDRNLNISNAMGFLTAIVLACILMSLLGWWWAGFALLIVIVLAFISTAAFLMLSS